MNKNEGLIWLNYENYWVIVGFNMCFCDLLWVFEARKICCNYLWLLAEPQLSQQMENKNIVNSVTVSSGPKIINRYHLSKKKSLYKKHVFGPPKHQISYIIYIYIIDPNIIIPFCCAPKLQIIPLWDPLGGPAIEVTTARWQPPFGWRCRTCRKWTNLI